MVARGTHSGTNEIAVFPCLFDGTPFLNVVPPTPSNRFEGQQVVEIDGSVLARLIGNRQLDSVDAVADLATLASDLEPQFGHRPRLTLGAWRTDAVEIGIGGSISHDYLAAICCRLPDWPSRRRYQCSVEEHRSLRHI